MSNGTRGLAQFRGIQLRDKIMRNRHFDENHKIDEKYIDIKWRQHREILEDTKIDVFVQSNDLEVQGQSSVDVTSIVGGRPVSEGLDSEGLVLDAKVELRKAGTEDFPKISETGARIYGKLRQDGEKFFLDFFYRDEEGNEVPHTFTDEEAVNIDFRFVVRTNLSVIPVDALITNGGGFVEGATDAKAYMNLVQLMKDIYGSMGVLNGDGQAILEKSIQDQINELKLDIGGTDQQLRDDLASREEGKGASLIGVIDNEDYEGLTVQEVLSNLASRLKSLETEVEEARGRQEAENEYFGEGEFTSIGDRIRDIEETVDTNLQNHKNRLDQIETKLGDGGEGGQSLTDRINYLEKKNDRFSFKAEGGETFVNLPDGKKANPNTLFFAVNGAIQAPGINYNEVIDPEDNGVLGVNFEPILLEEGDIIMLWWENMYLDTDTEEKPLSIVKLPDPDVLPSGEGSGVSFSPDGNYLAVAHNNSPYITIYKRNGDTFTKLPNPGVLPSNIGYGVSFSPDGNYLAVAHWGSPYITIYKRNGDTFTKLPDPDVLPSGTGNGVSFSPDGNYLAVAHTGSPYITIYKRNGDTFTKLPDPDVLPSVSGKKVSFSPDGNYLAVAHDGSLYITIYKRNGDTFTKLPDPDVLPSNTGYGVSFSPDGNYLAVTHWGSPYITIYKRNGDTFTKLPDPDVLPSDKGSEVSFSPDGNYLAVTHHGSPYITIYRG